MCNEYSPHDQLDLKQPHKRLSLLLLDCWQREYDSRPYQNFKMKRIDFEERMERPFDEIKDVEIIVQFLQQRPNLLSIYLSGLDLRSMIHKKSGLLQDFVLALTNIINIELKLMELPTVFFDMLMLNSGHLCVLNLVLEGTKLNDEDITILRSFLIVSSTLRSLNVAHCGITQFNFAVLADGVHKSRSLTNFKCCRLIGDGLTLDSTKVAHTVSSLIWQNKLTNLVMQQCEFISSDMEAVAEYLYNRDSVLLRLNLGYNLIGPDGAEYLFRAIAHSGTLTHLNIMGNNLGSQGGQVVARYMSSCFRLTYLNISYNNIGHEAMSIILMTIKKPIEWLNLKLCGNEFSSEAANNLRRLILARVLKQDKIDITFTFDETLSAYRIVPYF